MNITTAQAIELAQLIRQFADDDDVMLTSQGDGDLVVAFSLSTFVVAPNGDSQEV